MSGRIFKEIFRHAVHQPRMGTFFIFTFSVQIFAYLLLHINVWMHSSSYGQIVYKTDQTTPV